ncbi:MAG: folylpolyglutamate synthase/dihydrofolate synthase family protein [Thermoanaerobaculia bacterium]
MNRQLRYLDSLQASGIRPGLPRIRAVLREAGSPHRSYPSVLVAGTNGKGSTAATIASIVRSSGYRTGFYSSPHLIDIRERWMIDGEMVPMEMLTGAIDRMRHAAKRAGISPTYFEALTIIGFMIFEETGCELAVLEVGMGGRLDATNVVRPLASVITPVAFDHLSYLGTTLRSIAREKAGIIHRASIVLTSNTDPVVLGVIEKRARRFDAPLHVLSREVSQRNPQTASGAHFELTTPTERYQLDSPLSGNHQLDNLSLAVRTAEELRPHFSRITPESITGGVRDTRWRGRLEAFPVGGRTVYVDGAHNPSAAEAVARFVREHLDAPRTLVFGVMSDKAVGEICATLFPCFDRLVLTRPDSPRAASLEELEREASRYSIPWLGFQRPEDALRNAIADGSGPVVVCGSLYLAGDAVSFLTRITASASATISSSEESTRATSIQRFR